MGIVEHEGLKDIDALVEKHAMYHVKKNPARRNAPATYSNYNIDYGKFTKPEYRPLEVYPNSDSSVSVIFERGTDTTQVRKEIKNHLQGLLKNCEKEGLMKCINIISPYPRANDEKEIKVVMGEKILAVESAMLQKFLLRYGRDLRGYAKR